MSVPIHATVTPNPWGVKTTVIRPAYASVVSLMFIALLVLSGCGVAVRKPDVSEMKALQDSEQSLLLLRLVAEIDGTSRAASGRDGTERYLLALASIDAGIAPNHLWSRVTATEETAQDGWIYFFVKPGTYYISVVDPHPQLETRFQHLPSSTYWFHVPSGGKVLNLGSLKTSCTTKSGFFGRSLDACSPSYAIEDKMAGERFAAVTLSENWPVLHSGLKKARTPAESLKIADISPMAVAEAGSAGLERVPWLSRGINLATGGGAAFGAALQAREAGMALYLMYLPFGLLGGTISGAANEERWEPCMKGLEQTIIDFDLPGSLDGAVLRSFSGKKTSEFTVYSSNGATAEHRESEPKTILLFDMHKLRLAECSERGTFCVDLSVRARLWDAASARVLYDTVLYYGADAIRLGRPFYETSVSSSACRPMNAYCDKGGQKLFMEELARAVNAIAGALASDVGYNDGRSPADRVH